ncbi:hypothetical protein P7C70_g3688, partial [Phenoliferia sp. Uapishka_3]
MSESPSDLHDRFSQSLRSMYPSPPTAASEHFAALASQVLAQPSTPLSSTSSSADSDISLIRCQCLLILGLFECTEGAENKGWLRIGTAIRMAQVLRLGFEDEETGSRGRTDPLQAEIRRRTFWSCFLLDRTVTDGKERPCSLRPPHASTLRMPGPDADFLLSRYSPGACFEAGLPPWNISAKLDPSRASNDQEADLFGQTLRVAEIWHRVVSYVGAGGRNWDRRAPWDPDSSFAKLEKEITEWQAGLQAIFRYNGEGLGRLRDANLVAHSMIGQGRLFGMLHLLCACSNLILHRDYLPFLPGSDFKAENGPIDGEPLYGDLAAFAPPDWWEDSLSIAFDSAGVISDLCTSLSQHGSQITHPFAGFAALAAGTLHSHLKYWPKSCRKPINSSYYFDQDLAILGSLKGVYPIASIWCDGISRLDLLYSNLVRGVIDVDPSQVRSSVIKLLRTARDDDTTSPARSTNGRHSNNSTGISPDATPVLPVSMGGSTMSLFAPANPYTLDALPSPMGGLDSDYSLDSMAADEAFWGTWTDFSLFGLDTSGNGGVVPAWQ